MAVRTTAQEEEKFPKGGGGGYQVSVLLLLVSATAEADFRRGWEFPLSPVCSCGLPVPTVLCCGHYYLPAVMPPALRLIAAPLLMGLSRLIALDCVLRKGDDGEYFPANTTHVVFCSKAPPHGTRHKEGIHTFLAYLR